MAWLPYNVSVADTQGRALSGATVWLCSQPATVANPPSPLATIAINTSGTTGPNPITTNGYGQAVAYLDSGTLYTVVVFHELTGLLAYYDQWVGGPSTSTFTYTLQTFSGTGTSFTLNSTPNPTGALLLIRNGLVLLEGLGYTLAGTAITLATALQAGDSLFALIPSIS